MTSPEANMSEQRDDFLQRLVAATSRVAPFEWTKESETRLLAAMDEIRQWRDVAGDSAQQPVGSELIFPLFSPPWLPAVGAALGLAAASASGEAALEIIQDEVTGGEIELQISPDRRLAILLQPRDEFANSQLAGVEVHLDLVTVGGKTVSIEMARTDENGLAVLGSTTALEPPAANQYYRIRVLTELH